MLKNIVERAAGIVRNSAFKTAEEIPEPRTETLTDLMKRVMPNPLASLRNTFSTQFALVCLAALVHGMIPDTRRGKDSFPRSGLDCRARQINRIFLPARRRHDKNPTQLEGVSFLVQFNVRVAIHSFSITICRLLQGSNGGQALSRVEENKLPSAPNAGFLSPRRNFASRHHERHEVPKLLLVTILRFARDQPYSSVHLHSTGKNFL